MDNSSSESSSSNLLSKDKLGLKRKLTSYHSMMNPNELTNNMNKNQKFTETQM